ncbi:hypothetical protein [Gloeobacter morelensis]|uniref:hypothetical protein n=1 Tax=Gloeobacter morelensis TaxID=2907343 RepID=UPI001E449320|nr:hypothetical protein [Gloeobacter morelensis]UFP97181.1 hypothetical protein ISF26_23965 [Gloeobacter morelensis MG652769]
MRSPATLFAGKWRLGKTAPIRVPVVLAGPLLRLARRIDSGELPADLLERLDLGGHADFGPAECQPTEGEAQG